VSHDLVDRLRLVRSPGIGPVTYRQLISRFGSASAALDAVPDLAARGGGRVPRLASRADAEREMARVEALGARYLLLGKGLYPPALAELDDAPPIITIKGDVRLLEKALVAIVGARNASALRHAPFQGFGESDAKFVKTVRFGQHLQAVVLDLVPERTGMAACKNDRQLRQAYFEFARKSHAVHRTWHHDVGEDDIYLRPGGDNPERVRGIGGTDDLIAKLLQHFSRHSRDLIVILDQQDLARGPPCVDKRPRVEPGPSPVCLRGG